MKPVGKCPVCGISNWYVGLENNYGDMFDACDNPECDYNELEEPAQYIE